MSFGDGGAGKEARRARMEEEVRKRKIEEGTSKVRKMFSDQFGWDYYEGEKGLRATQKEADQTEFKIQYEDAIGQLQSALARAGLRNSTVGAQRTAEMERRRILTGENIDKRAQAAVDERKRSTADSESLVLGQLQSSADVSSSLNQASQRIASNSAQPTIAPLGMVFSDITAGLATQADMERQGTNRYDMGVSNFGNNMRRYMRNIGSGG